MVTGYSPAAIKKWAERAKTWEKGDKVKDLPALADTAKAKKRDVFIYMINGAKERAPAAAAALLAQLGK